MPKVSWSWTVWCTRSLVANCIRFPAVQNFWKSVKIWQSYRQLKGGNFLRQCRLWADAQRDAAQPNIGGALWESSVIPFFIPRRKVWMTPLLECRANIAERKTWTQSEFYTWWNSVRGQGPPKMNSVPAQEMAKHRAKFGWPPVNNVAAVLVTKPITRNPLKFAGVPQTRQQMSVASGRKFAILWGHLKEILLCNKFFSNCRRFSPTMLCDSAQMAIFCVLYFQRAACSTF